MNLLEHSQDCLPLMPCAACDLVAWLRSKLDPKDFAELVNRAGALNPPKPKRGRRRNGPGATLGVEPPPQSIGGEDR
jgi:hypothetical protein